MFHTSAKQKIHRKHIILRHEPLREQTAFHMMYILPILKLDPMEYFYPKLSATTVHNYSKQAVLSASDYIETAYRDIRIFLQLTQCCVFNRHFDDA